jgi:acylphosphatase
MELGPYKITWWAAPRIEARVTGSADSGTISPVVAETREAKRFFVSGNVQGVGFRYFAARAAEQLGLTGYVRNLNDGRVEIYAVGSRGQLGELRHELERGPLGASVEGVSEEPAELAPTFMERFSVERDA